MRRVLCLLSVLGLLLASPPARAISEGATFHAFLDEGPALAYTGSLEFTLTEEQIGMFSSGWALMCRYIMEWRSDVGVPIETFCSVDEVTGFGQHDCMANARSSVGSIIMRVPNSPCAGFDSNLAAHNVFQFVAAESADGLYGLIQFTAASAHVSGFRALAAQD